MKSTFRKVFSLMLVAMLLVSAIPFQASATETRVGIKVDFMCDGQTVATYESATGGVDTELAQNFAEDFWNQANGENKDQYENPQANGEKPGTTEDNKFYWTVTVTKIEDAGGSDDDGDNEKNSRTGGDTTETWTDFQINYVCNGTTVYTYTGEGQGQYAALDQGLATQWWNENSKKTAEYQNPTVNGQLPETKTNEDGEKYYVWTVTVSSTSFLTYQIRYMYDGKVIATYTDDDEVGIDAPLSQEIANEKWNLKKVEGYTNPTVNGQNPSIESEQSGKRRVWYVNLSKAGTTTNPTNPGPSTSGETITLKVLYNDDKNPSGTYYYKPNGSSAAIKDILTGAFSSSWADDYTFVRANVGNPGENEFNTTSSSTTVKAGGYVNVRLDDGTSDTKFPYSVYLHIYSRGSVGSPIKTVTLDTWGCVKDGVISRSEIEDVVKNYYTAKDSDGIQYDGIYYSTSTTKTDYIKDKNKTDKVTNLDELRAKGYVHLNVWIDNYKAKTSSNNNSTNPKTGDSIVMSVSALGITASALAAAYYVSKKRSAR